MLANVIGFTFVDIAVSILLQVRQVHSGLLSEVEISHQEMLEAEV